MLRENLEQDSNYQREIARYQLLLQAVKQSGEGAGEELQAASKALDLQMIRLQVAELHWQANHILQAPRQLTAVWNKTLQALYESKRLVEDTVRNNEVFLKQIAATQAILAESQQLLDQLNLKE